MKTSKKTLKLALCGVLTAIVLSACGKIPSAYQGDYGDLASGAKLTLGAESGSMKLSSGREIKGDAADMGFDALFEGKPGIYLQPTADNPDEVEVYWLLPRKETRQQPTDFFVWYQAEVLYTRMNSKAKDKVQQMMMRHCDDGQVLLDLPSKTFHGGCPAGSLEYSFVRSK